MACNTGEDEQQGVGPLGKTRRYKLPGMFVLLCCVTDRITAVRTSWLENPTPSGIRISKQKIFLPVFYFSIYFSTTVLLLLFHILANFLSPLAVSLQRSSLPGKQNVLVMGSRNLKSEFKS